MIQINKNMLFRKGLMMSGSHILQDRYKILETLGEGGMGKVYLAENIKLGTLWAIKEISKKNEMKIDFLAEPNILKKLEHPALPRVFDIIENEECIYVVVDYIEGISLDIKLTEEGSLPEAFVLDIAIQLCQVLNYLHEYKPNPIIYRDMKPSNIILAKSGSLKLIDFGIAREYKSDSPNDTVYIGTRGYAAPEQYGSGQTSVATDIYSLGVTLYQLLTGKSPNEQPYELKPIRTYNPGLSSAIEKIIGKCTRQNPPDRYQSVGDLLTDLKLVGKEKTEVSGNKPGYGCSGEAGIKYRSFKKLVLTVWDNFEFGCELAYQAAKASNYNILLIDLDLLAPKADICLNLKKYPGRFLNEGRLLKSGLDIVIDAAEKSFLSPDLIAETALKRKDMKNLFVLTGNYMIENYEYYNDESLIRLIEKAYIGFDLTILLVNKSIYDSFTVISLSKSDYNLAAIRADLDKLRETNNYLAFLKEKQYIPLD
ncbi:MAG: serine/threonine protein kinase [Ruminiclostridium sp.]|nr:serine/threonine protein kinase [Ruminiclostridium sp.]